MSLPSDPQPEDVERILAEGRGKDFDDLRDRTAYVHVTGTYPSHLRVPFTRALSIICEGSNRPTSLDRTTGNMKVKGAERDRLRLNQHPMVRKAKEFTQEGWRIQLSLGANNRKPYTKIFLHKGRQRVTVQVDGSVLDHWPYINQD